MQTVRNLAECRANWQGYDESFWAVRAMQGVVLGFSELRIVAESCATAAALDRDTRGASLYRCVGN